MSLTFTGESYDSVYQKLDSVKITNLSRSWSETIVNDTVFTIANHVGIADYAEKAFGLTLGSANESSAEVLLSMPVAGNVNLELYDISGRKLATVSQNLTTGTHAFNVEMQKSQICFLRATSQSGTASIKMLSLGNGSENAISYASLRSNNVQLRHTSTNYFETGDQMQYMGYTTYRDSLYSSESVKKAQTESETIMLMFDICYVVETADTITTCDSLDWNGIIYKLSGDYKDTLQTINSCDSVVTLHLTINKKVTQELIETSCDSYKWNDSTYTNTGDYQQTFTAVNGCDSVVTLHLIIVFKDTRDGNMYSTVKIGGQIWMAEDLKYLPSVSAPATGSEDAAGSYYYVYGYNGEDTSVAKAYTLATAVNGVPAGTNTYETFGVLYNWTAAMGGSSSSSANPSGIQGVCPSGWHLPSDAEWKEMEMYLGMSQTDAGLVLYRGAPVGSKLAGNASLWINGTLETTTGFGTSGFSALPGGTRYGDGSYGNLGGNGYWWSATESTSTIVWGRVLYCNNAGVYRHYYDENSGFSVRCVKD